VDKAQKKELRRLAGLVYERELGHWLRQLRDRFDDWQRGEIAASELSEHVHEYDQGPARVVWARHTHLPPVTRVAWGLAEDLLDEAEVEPRLLELVRESAEVLRALHHDQDAEA
jgi:hypothetical protein